MRRSLADFGPGGRFHDLTTSDDESFRLSIELVETMDQMLGIDDEAGGDVGPAENVIDLFNPSSTKNRARPQ